MQARQQRKPGMTHTAHARDAKAAQGGGRQTCALLPGNASVALELPRRLCTAEFTQHMESWFANTLGPEVRSAHSFTRAPRTVLLERVLVSSLGSQRAAMEPATWPAHLQVGRSRALSGLAGCFVGAHASHGTR